ncbi:hypothetical protein PN466_16255 [Roseofilum reptotaenium CS-1145]|uniref:Uncharacterized protein n=1 Tax=Roseofilum reptotaenium AO1-A TaxID=1925591 RepID=A0A1L9QWM0_9CYAN|nr:hypothetical protein [Roseofilum reptotaenium]MDB9518498.1 hypothetical protein [Roseofilum reptotaenium CS-1145]OJJ27091.1 hypothetical protein BI308_03320 [Roseofilum reptotaenium AO1-A]
MRFPKWLKKSSSEHKKIPPEDERRIIQRFEEFSSQIPIVPEILPRVTFDATIGYFESDRPSNPVPTKGVMICQKHREGYQLAQLFLDENNQLIVRRDGSPYGRQLVARELDDKLWDSFDKTSSVLVIELGNYQPKTPVIEPEVIPVSDEIQLTVKGLPSELSEEERQSVFESLVRNTLLRVTKQSYQAGEKIHQGKFSLKVKGIAYEIMFSLDAIQAIAALQIYKDAFEKIKQGAKEGIYDLDLAESAAQYIKESAWDEVRDLIYPKISQPKSHNMGD